MNELTEQLIALALKGIGGILAIWIARKAGSLINTVETKYDVDIDNAVEANIRLVVKRIVQALFQAEVRGLKKLGKFDAGAQRLVLQKAMKSIKEEVKDTIMDIDGDKIQEMIEAVIAEEKKEGKKK